MIPFTTRRALFFGGKGGVGKTTCSSALAVAASRRGRRVLLVSTDPAHSISDIFERPIGPAECEVLPGLRALEIAPEIEVRRYVDAAKARLGALFSPGVVKAAARQIELAATMPGVADAAVFERVAEMLLAPDAGRLTIFDTAPTGHALRLLRMPELMTSWMDALVRHRREARAGSDAGGEGEDGRDAALLALQERAARLARVRDELTRADRVGVVLVLVPERLPIEETARATHQLEEARIPLAALVVNRVLPEHAEGGYLRARREQERYYLEEIGRRFTTCPRVSLPQLESDVHGVDALDRLGRHLLAD